MVHNVECNSSCVELKTNLIYMKEIILKQLMLNRTLDTCNDFVLWADIIDLEVLADKIEKAITVTHCCMGEAEQFYCSLHATGDKPSKCRRQCQECKTEPKQ